MQLVNNVIVGIKAGLRSERGQDLLEYALLSGLIAAAIITAFSLAAFTGALDTMATNIAACVDFDPSPCSIEMP